MTLAEFVRRISFRVFKPHSSLLWYRRLDHRISRLGLSLEILNTHLPDDRSTARAALCHLCNIPRMSTYAIGAIIDKAVSSMPSDAKFVNVGAWHGFTFLAGISSNPDKQAVCVDNFSQFGGPREEFLERFRAASSSRHSFHEMDYEHYFASVHQGAIGVYIYDGEHSYRNQLRGLEIAEPFFVSGTIILVDDTNEEDPRKATLDFISRRPGEYVFLHDMKTSCNGHPTFWNGLMVVVKT